MKAADSSVAVAAFAPWHEAHEAANEALDDTVQLPAHCLAEVYATLTRLPDPFRAPAPVVAEFLHLRFRNRVLAPAGEVLLGLPRRLSDAGIVGGAVYDALVAETARSHRATLLSLDHRAARTYRLLGAAHELLSA